MLYTNHFVNFTGHFVADIVHLRLIDQNESE